MNPRKNPFNDYEQMPSARQQPMRGPSDSFLFASSQARPKKEFGMFSKRYLPREVSAGQSAINRSRMTQQHSLSASGWGLGV
jgi:hypothetical protein